MNIGEARCAAQAYVGEQKLLVACWQPPDDPYRLTGRADEFVFRVEEVVATRVGGDRYIAVCKITGQVRSFEVGE